MQAELKVRRIKMPKKTYDYLYVPIPKAIIETLRPRLAVVKIGNYPPLRLKIRFWSDGNGYVIIPRKVAEYLSLRPGQVVNVDYEFKK